MIQAVKSITLTASGGTFNIPPTDPYSFVYVTSGAGITLSNPVTFSGDAAVGPTTGEVFTLFFSCNITSLGGMTINAFGTSITLAEANGPTLVKATYNGSAYDVAVLSGGDGTIETAKLADNAVTLAKLDDLTQGSLIVGKTASDTPTELDASGSAKLLIGDGTDLNSVATSGDVTIDPLGAMTIGADKVTNAKLANAPAQSIKCNPTSASANLQDVTLSDGEIVIANATALVGVTMSGDATISNTGVVTLANNAVVTGNITNANVTGAKIATDTISLSNFDQNVLYYVDSSAFSTAASTAKQTMATFTLTANDLHDTNTGLEIIASGTTGATANNKTFGIDLVDSGGTTTLLTNTSTAAPNGLDYKMKLTFIRTGASSYVAFGEITFDGVAPQITDAITGTIGADTFTANNLVFNITGTESVATGSDITLTMLLVKLLL